MSTPILPKRMPVIDAAAHAKAIQAALDETAVLVLTDFETTTATWSHSAGFTVAVGAFDRVITSGDAIYQMLNAGTRAHVIRAKRGRLRFFGPFRAKTAPKSIFSGPGYVGGNLFYPKVVNHPGTKARQWDATIAKKYRKAFPKLMQQYLKAAIR
jgi:hypothetical protein